jgi:excisionase family DNA binding protein
MKYRNQAIKYPSGFQSLISAEQAADYLGVSTRTMANWRCRGFPNIQYTKIGRCIRYRLSELDAYIAKHSHNVEV